MNKIPRYERVDDHTIRIVIEKADEVPVSRLLENKKQLEEQRDNITKVLKNIDKMLAEAKKLGITPKPKAIDKKCSLCKGKGAIGAKSQNIPCPKCNNRVEQ